MHIPTIGRLYFVPEVNLYCIFRGIYFGRSKKNINVDFYKDALRKEPVYNYDIIQAFEFDLSDFTFQYVVSTSEMRRRPFDFVDLDGAISLITTKKKFQGIHCRITLFSPVKFQSQVYDWKTNKSDTVEVESSEFAGIITSESDGKLNIKLYGETVAVDISNIKTLKFRLYEFRR